MLGCSQEHPDLKKKNIYIYIYIKGEGDTAWEAEAQLYSDNSVDLKIMQVKGCKKHKQRDRETQQHYQRPEKNGSDTIKGEGDTALEAEAQLYSYNSVDLKIMQV